MPVVIYSALRLLLMGAVFFVTYLLGAGVLIAALVAIIVGWALAFLLFKAQADAATTWLAERRKAQAEGRIPRFSAQISADEAAEDALLASDAESTKAPRETTASPETTAPPADPTGSTSQDETDSEQ